MTLADGSGRDGRVDGTSDATRDDGRAGGRRPRPPTGGPRPRYRLVRRLAGGALGAVLLVGGIGGVVAWQEYARLSEGLPTVDGLRTYQPPVMSRLYSGDDQIMAELAAERRIFVPYSAIPERVRNAFLAAEDQKFFSHGGVDPLAIIRAGLTDLMMHGSKHRPIGASTITQQVARIMLLGSNAVSMERKAKEALLAMRLEQTLSKQQILEIYLNEIYLGNGAYGIGAAAQTYFNKPLDQLDNAEAAFLGALPKSPTNYNPVRFPQAATGRRNWVLERMAELHAITPQDARAAEQEPLIPSSFTRPGPVPGSEWFSEEVRRQLIEKYGVNSTMEGGLSVHTSMDPHLQQVATVALHEGLMRYDRAHGGWRGPVTHLDGVDPQGDWANALARVSAPPSMLTTWRLAVVLSATTGQVGWLEGTSPAIPHTGELPARDRSWMRAGKGIATGDVVMVEPMADSSGVALRQVPRVEGALTTIDVRTGRVLAMVGGWSFRASQFNRVTQAARQPGSSFKPFVYLAAMEQGISPSQKFDDSPVSYGEWHPNNYEKDFWGPTMLHDALRESRNLVTIRLAAQIGMKSVADMAQKLDLVHSMPLVLPAALGAVETTVMREAGAYATLAAGGHLVTPTLIDDVKDRNGNVIWRAPGLQLGPVPSAAPAAAAGSDVPAPAPAPDAAPAADAAATPSDTGPVLVDTRPQVVSADSAYQVVTMLRDVIRRGTGVRAGVGIDRPVAGKTGTSQDFNDAWFAGFSPDLVTVVWIGFDTPQSLGRNETGGVIAGPIWNQVMKAALADRPRLDFRAPPDMRLAQYNTGMGMAIDAFKPDQQPGISVDMGAGAIGTLTAADTGAENMPDSESDMATMPGHGPVGNGVPGAVSPGTSAPPPPSGGDIGMGGLY
ncbi:PBP1A family penicillin-binding protein [Gluconacetobacter entanii]|uniref:penicillin-binding protein 1A n=1 Tax=Gluconacetobacter entanii TaxID=108528 RepID=UPI00187B304F|nr:PBP1A family penicillin-binding protein [Gluconacetobacter entanii]MBE7620571.1 PBP1A family penicillin-binding protein [Komagataeibacter sp. FXV2]MBY4640910.1 PBP1A family penicillin-binding protein [Gluconacetobacter entanii]MCW4580529.1 PBP1A family penicillin-binding protein [Gluconacetobacter entanii]MCW4583850.1 PBP1A family penicillin-binding protein [Gluconacetobacter entanii]MCW4587195.1 PBP1A family penicillin-binding protein [Gluconacetobacter entanii]